MYIYICEYRKVYAFACMCVHIHTHMRRLYLYKVLYNVYKYIEQMMNYFFTSELNVSENEKINRLMGKIFYINPVYKCFKFIYHVT